MSKPPSTRKQANSGGTRVWLWLLVLVVVAAGAVYIFARKPAAPAEENSTSAAPQGPTTFVPQHIYSQTADPKTDIERGLAQAKREGKRVLLDFGGDWCGDCQVLDFYFHQPPNAQLLANNFVLVHIWIGQMDRNIDIAAKYGVPISRGVPALAILDSSGKVIYSQNSGQFADMRHMEASSVTDFLEKWKS